MSAVKCLEYPGTLKMTMEPISGHPDTESFIGIEREHRTTACSVSVWIWLVLSSILSFFNLSLEMCHSFQQHNKRKYIAYLIAVMNFSSESFSASMQWKYWIWKKICVISRMAKCKYVNFWHSRGFVCLSCNLVQQACFPSLVFCFPHAAFRTGENLSDCKLKDDEEKHSWGSFSFYFCLQNSCLPLLSYRLRNSVLVVIVCVGNQQGSTYKQETGCYVVR